VDAHRPSTRTPTPGRNVVERCFARLKQFRALATRYAKRAAYYRAILIITATVLWLREDPQDTP
jgi:transposase